jgi:hypothetical protein
LAGLPPVARKVIRTTKKEDEAVLATMPLWITSNKKEEEREGKQEKGKKEGKTRTRKKGRKNKKEKGRGDASLKAPTAGGRTVIVMSTKTLPAVLSHS